SRTGDTRQGLGDRVALGVLRTETLMRARRYLKWETALLFILLVFPVLLFRPVSSQSSRINLENAERIRPGMTREDVESILGPERDETGGESLPIYPPKTRSRQNPAEPSPFFDRYWISRDASITIRFTKEGSTVVRVWASDLVHDDASAWERFRGFLRRILG